MHLVIEFYSIEFYFNLLQLFIALIASAAAWAPLVSSQRAVIPHYSPHNWGLGNGVSARYQDKVESGLGLPYGLGYGRLGYGLGGLGYGVLGNGYGGLGLGYGNLGLGYGRLLY